MSRFYVDIVTIGDVDVYQVSVDPNLSSPVPSPRIGSISIQKSGMDSNVWQYNGVSWALVSGQRSILVNGGATVNLEPAASLPPGFRTRVVQLTAGTVTISPSGGDTIDGVAGPVTTTSQYESIELTRSSIPDSYITTGSYPAASGGGVTVEDEGTGLGSFSALNFVGPGVTAVDAGGGVAEITIPGGGGGVTGPGSSVDNTLARFDGTSGNAIQDSGIVVDDSDNVAGIGTLNTTGDVNGRDMPADGIKLDGIQALADVTNTANVNAAGAVMHTDFPSEVGFMIRTGSEAYGVIKYNLAATAAPAASDDSSAGYAVGSQWIDVSADAEYVCLDASVGAAVWIETTASGGGVDAEDEGTPLGSFGTINFVGAGVTASDAGGGVLDVSVPGGGGGGGVTQTNAVYVSKAGNDANSGLRDNRPKLTIASAITAANGLAPSPTNRVTIWIQDGGTYVENVTLPANVSLDGDGATVEGVISLGVRSRLRLHRVVYSPVSGNAILFNSGIGDAWVDVDEIDRSGGGIFGGAIRGAAPSGLPFSRLEQVVHPDSSRRIEL